MIIGNNVTIKTHNSIWNGITIEDNVFVGQGDIFCNYKYPKANNISKVKLFPTKCTLNQIPLLALG